MVVVQFESRTKNKILVMVLLPHHLLQTPALPHPGVISN